MYFTEHLHIIKNLIENISAEIWDWVTNEWQVYIKSYIYIQDADNVTHFFELLRVCDQHVIYFLFLA